MKIQNLTVEKNGKTILQDLSVDFEEGKTHIIMGPNGSGKSTLFYTIAGHPDCHIINGEIIYKEQSILDLEIYQRSLNGIHLSVQYPPQIDGLSHAAFLKEAMNAKLKFENKEAIDEFQFLKQVKHFSQKYNFPNTYFKQSLNAGFSGGEKKRNEILQIDLLQPEFVMLDEIDSGLDIEMMKVISTFIKNYSSGSKTSIIVTHYPQFATLLEPDFVHILKNGKIAKTGDKSLIDQVEQNGFGDY